MLSYLIILSNINTLQIYFLRISDLSRSNKCYRFLLCMTSYDQRHHDKKGKMKDQSDYKLIRLSSVPWWQIKRLKSRPSRGQPRCCRAVAGGCLWSCCEATGRSVAPQPVQSPLSIKQQQQNDKTVSLRRTFYLVKTCRLTSSLLYSTEYFSIN